MLRDVRTSDVVLAMFLVAITAMLLVPLPTLLLDFLLVINISCAVLVLLAGLYMPNALAMLSFPSLLLLTTLFRLGLNVASTRLILSQGDAGRVIQAFGNFLIRGEVVVGIIIFLIITIVNFIVIAKGASRVSEVAARFTLDALPGKQLAIDADLRSGLISAEEAQRRREDLRKESQLYGSMDGAMKFVQGDAIAGLFIIAVNILGGIYLGVRGGLDFSQATQTYTVLTVGDGLVNQIPAILISICSGIVVTRVASSEESSLGSDLQAQIFRRPGSMMAAGALMILIGLGGLPIVPFASVGMFLMSVGMLQRRARRMHGDELTRGGGAALHSVHGGVDEDSENPAPILLALDPNYLFPFYRSELERFHGWWQELQGDLYSELGLRLPALRSFSDPGLATGHYAIRLGGSVVYQGKLRPHAVLVEANPDYAALLGLEVAMDCEHPTNGSRVFWAPDSPALRRITAAGDIRVFGPLQYLGLKAAAFLVRAPEEALTVAEVSNLESALEKRFPGLLGQTINRQFLSMPRLAEILQQLVREGISVRDFRQIIEAIATYCATAGASLVQEGEFDLQDIVSFVRVSRRRHIVAKLLSPRQTLKAIALSEEVQNLLEESPPPSPTGQMAIPPELLEHLKRGLHEVMQPFLKHGLLPVAVLSRADMRSRISSILTQFEIMPGIVTLEELEPSVAVEPVGQWQMQ